MVFYAASLAALCALNAIIIYNKYRGQSAKSSAAPFSAERRKTARDFQWRFLVVYAFAVAADWLQGPHMYAMYRYDKQLSERAVALLYATGFVSAAASATYVGMMIDRLGSRSACYEYTSFYIYSIGMLSFNRLPFLFLGRVLGGIATTLLFSAFESWVISEYHTLKLDDSVLPLKTVFENMTLVSGAVAILSGITGDVIVRASGSRFLPFIAVQACCLVAGRLINRLWRKDSDIGPVLNEQSTGCSLGIVAVLTSKKSAALAVVTCCFEGAMYLFVFFWTAALESVRLRAGITEEPPLGLIFSSFMCAMMAGSLVVSVPFRAPSKQSATADVLLAMLIASGCLSCAVFLDGERTLFWTFCVFEATVGAYFPAMGFLKSELVGDDVRGQVYSALRLPLNLFVLVAHGLDREGDEHRERVFLMLAGLLLLASAVAKRLLA